MRGLTGLSPPPGLRRYLEERGTVPKPRVIGAVGMRLPDITEGTGLGSATAPPHTPCSVPEPGVHSSLQ